MITKSEKRYNKKDRERKKFSQGSLTSLHQSISKQKRFNRTKP